VRDAFSALFVHVAIFEMGQNAKYSERADDFRLTLKADWRLS
jgi:hypothetical protein